jgi:hypothetical protein
MGFDHSFFVEASSMKLLIGCAAILGLSAVTAVAGEGRLSNQSLARLGLGGMQLMSDSQGLEIRGLGVQESGQQGNYGNNDNRQKGEKNKHEQKCCEEKNRQECHERQNCCHSTCHIQTSICHLECCGRIR